MVNTKPSDSPCLTYSEARSRAEQAAKVELSEFALTEPASYLSKLEIEADSCWFFFANEEIELPPIGSGRLIFSAYAVSQSGQCNLVYDFRADMNKMNEYVSLWSLHAQGKKVEAELAFMAFLEKYPVENSDDA
jgi:hypothetical protein